MLVLAIIITLSLTMYLFYKTRFIRTSSPQEKRCLKAKCNISLGLFVATFGLNQFFIHQTIIGTVIGIIFLLLGGYNVFAGARAYRFYSSFSIEDTSNNE